MINYNIEDLEIFENQYYEGINKSSEEDFIMYQTYLAITDYIINKISEEKILNTFQGLNERQRKIIKNREIAREKIRGLK